MNAVITNKSAKIGDFALSALSTKRDLIGFLGLPSRKDVQSCSMSIGGTRSAYVYDELGIIFYHDEPEDKVSHITLAISPADTPQKPTNSFCGEISFNDAFLDQGTVEKLFLRTNGKLVSGHHGIYSYVSDAFSCWFSFGKIRNRIGKRSGRSVLLYVQVTFPRPAEPNRIP